jgi:endo-1,4-beta-xylanase
VCGALATTLREAGDAAGVHMGSQFKHDMILQDSVYKATHSAQYGLSTVGNACKWQATHPQQGTYSLTKCEESYAYAITANQLFRGHNLCWGNDNPKWLLDGNFTADELRSILTEHITTTMRSIKEAGGGKSPYAWDVVNEACNQKPANATDYFKPAAPWYPALPDYVEIAFRAARAADPDTLLFYNDFGAEQALTSKADNVYRMLKGLLARGVPVDGVGLQMHVGTPQGDAPGGHVVNATLVQQNIARFGALGLKVHVTEMDVKCADPCGAEDLQKQAGVYGALLEACLRNKGVCVSYETWGFTDAVTWLTGKRCPTESCHPLPFDEQYKAKPAVAAMLAVLANHTRAEGAAPRRGAT